MYQNSYAVFSATTSDFKQQKYIITNHVCINLLRLQVRLGSQSSQWRNLNTFSARSNESAATQPKHTKILSPQFTPLQQQNNLQPRSTKSGLEQLPTQLNAQCNCLPPFQPYQPLQSEQDSLVPSVSHLRWARRRLESGVGATSKKGKWAEQLGRRWEKESMLSQCLMMVVKVFVVAILF